MKNKFILPVLLFAGVLFGASSCSDMLTPDLERYAEKNGTDTIYSYLGILKSVQNIAERKQKLCKKTIIEGAFPAQGEVIALHDIPKQFGEFKKYSDRFVTIVDTEQ